MFVNRGGGGGVRLDLPEFIQLGGNRKICFGHTIIFPEHIVIFANIQQFFQTYHNFTQ
jgi:hypothetical protein